MRLKNVILALLLGSIGVAALAAYGTPATPVKTTLTVALNGEPNTLDPTLVSDRLSQTFQANMFDSLVVIGEDTKLAPGLAESWSTTDSKTWTFKLRRGVKFHNGEEFSADSVKASIDRINDPALKSPSKGRIADIDRVEIVDPYTVNIIAKAPNVRLPATLSQLYGNMVPPKYIKEVGNAGFARKPVGTGPFKFVEWVKDDHMTFAANEGYWRGAPAIKRLIVKPIVESSSRMASLQTGAVDIASNVPPQMVEQLKADSKLNIVSLPSTRFFFLVLDTTKRPFNDVRVRQAVNYAIDQDALIRAVQAGHGHKLAQPIIPQAFGFNPDVKGYPTDLGRAKKLLADAGYPTGFDTEFDNFTGSIVDHSKTGEAVVAQLAKVGIRAKMNLYDMGVFNPNRLANKTSAVYIYSFGEWALDADNTFGLLLQTRNGYYYNNPDIIALWKKEQQTSDPRRREQMLKDLQDKFQEEAPYGVLYQLDSIWGMGKDVNFRPRIDEMLWFYRASFK